MKTLTLVLLLIALPIPAEAGKNIEQTLEVDASALVHIEDPNGQIEVHGWDKNAVRVSGTISSQAREYSFEKQGDRVIFEVEYNRDSNWQKKGRAEDSSRLTFYMPAQGRLNISTINGDINVAGVAGGTDIESVNGSIVTSALKQRINIETVNGNVSSKDNHGKLEIETISGNISDENSSGKLSLSTVQGNVFSKSQFSIIEIENVNGELDLQLDRVDDISIDSVNGKIKVSLSLNKDGEMSVSNVSGDMFLYFDPNISADFHIDAFVNGSIINTLTGDKPEKQKFGLGQILQFSINGGTAQVAINTVSGRIEIRPR